MSIHTGQKLYIICHSPQRLGTVVVTNVGKQWFDYITDSGVKRKEQRKFIAPVNVKYADDCTSYQGDKFFHSEKDAMENAFFCMKALEKQYESLALLIKEYQSMFEQH